VDNQTDQQLLRDYSGRRSEPAFAELVRRHVDLVYSAALRMVRDPHLAQDVTQAVFVALAQNAGQLAHRPVLSGWLHRTAQNLAANTVRSTVRRRAREQEAAAMNELLAHESDAVWEHIAPHLDAALGELAEPDRDALLLRYFERKSAREMALTLGVSEEAAQKRVTRAVERLREFFAKRGVTIGAGGLVVLITANAVQAAPAGLAVAITAALAGTSIVTTATAAAAKAIAMTTLQKTLIAAALAVAVGTGIYEARQASTLRNQVQALQQEPPPPSDQISQLRQELADTTARLTALRQENEQLRQSAADLPRLRGELTRLETTQPQRKAPALDSAVPPLDVYADLTHRTILHGALRRLPVTLTPLMLAEPDKATAILNEELSKQGYRLVLDGEKFVQILPAAEEAARTSPLFADSNPGVNASIANKEIDFTSIDLGTFLDFCGAAFNRTILRSSSLPTVTIALRCATPLTRDELFHAICVVLSLNNLALVPDGDKFVQIVTASATARVHADAPASESGALIQPAQVPVVKPPSPRPALARQPETPEPTVAPATLNDLMRFYARQQGKTFQPSRQSVSHGFFFEVRTPLTQAELLYAIKTTLALNELAIEPADGGTIHLIGLSQRQSPEN
jgi:RNA polymerase sigma factor (sigma-70 family)